MEVKLIRELQSCFYYSLDSLSKNIMRDEILVPPLCANSETVSSFHLPGQIRTGPRVLTTFRNVYTFGQTTT